MTEPRATELALDSTGTDVAIPPSLIRGTAAVCQRINVRLSFFLGEWFLDARLGMPYYRDVLVKNPDMHLIRSLYRKAILSTPCVLAVNKLDIVLDTASREASIEDLEILLTGGTIYRSQPGQFVVAT